MERQRFPIRLSKSIKLSIPHLKRLTTISFVSYDNAKFFEEIFNAITLTSPRHCTIYADQKKKKKTRQRNFVAIYWNV